MDFEVDFDNQVWVSRKEGAERRKEKIEARGMGDEGRDSPLFRHKALAWGLPLMWAVIRTTDQQTNRACAVGDLRFA